MNLATRDVVTPIIDELVSDIDAYHWTGLRTIVEDTIAKNPTIPSICLADLTPDSLGGVVESIKRSRAVRAVLRRVVDETSRITRLIGYVSQFRDKDFPGPTGQGIMYWHAAGAKSDVVMVPSIAAQHFAAAAAGKTPTISPAQLRVIERLAERLRFAERLRDKSSRMGRLNLDEACEAYAEWRDHGPEAAKRKYACAIAEVLA